MKRIEREDDFASRRKHLHELSDDELHARFWELVNQIVSPLIDEARSHTTPSIERSVLLRMGFSSLEAGDLVAAMHQRDLLGHGAGRQILELANKQRISIRDAGSALLEGRYWKLLPL